MRVLLVSLLAFALLLIPHAASADLLDTSPSFRIERLDYDYDNEVLAAAAGDGFVVVWAEYYSLEGPHVVLGTTIGPNGDTTGGRFAISDGVNYFETSSQPSVAQLPAGGFIVSWVDYDSPKVIRGQRFDSAAAPVAAELVIAEPGLSYQSNPQVAAATDGSFLVAWRSTAGPEREVRAMRFDAGGVPAPSVVVATNSDDTEIERPLTASGGNDGSFVVAWSAGVTYETGEFGGYYPYTRTETDGRVVDSNGTPSGPIFDAGGLYGPQVRHLSNNDFVVAWSGSYRSYDVYPGPLNAYARIHHSEGGSDTLQVSEPRGYDADGPVVALASVPDDGFVVAWSHYAPEGPAPADAADVYVRQFMDDGGPKGRAVPLNFEFRSLPPLAPTLAVSDGRALIAWNDGYEIRGQILDIVDQVLCGDANSDETITAVDALAALSSAVGIRYCSRLLCDADGDGSTDASDALLILMAAVGSVPAPSCT